MAVPDRVTSHATSDTGRRFVWHGLLLFLLALIGGMFVYAMANPRMGLSMHVGGLLNATFLIAIGAAWSAVVLSPGAERAAFWLLVVSSYGGSLGLLLAAVLGTRDSTPMHGAAQAAAAWRETVVMLLLNVNGVAIVVGCAIALLGFGRRGGRSR